jgi:hypothetical protein
MCIIKIDLGQATRPLCKGRRKKKKKKKKKKLKKITTYQISKRKIEVISFSLIVKE